MTFGPRLGNPSMVGSRVRWVGRGNGVGLALGSLHVSFLGSWVGWVGCGNGVGSHWAPFMFPFAAPLSDGWAVATGFHWAPFMFPFWVFGLDGWAAATGLGSHWAPFMFPF